MPLRGRSLLEGLFARNAADPKPARVHRTPRQWLEHVPQVLRAMVRADGTLCAGPAVGSIHKIGALVQGLPACNGWTFWHVDRPGGRVLIDELRTAMRASMREAAE